MTPDFRQLLTLEAALIHRLQKSWDEAASAVYDRIAKACESQDWDRAVDLVRFLDMSTLGSDNREYIKYVLLASATFGAQMAANGESTFFSSGKYDTTLNNAVQQMQLYFQHNATVKVREEALQSIADQRDEKAPKLAAERYIKPMVSFKGKGGLNQIQLTSSLHSSRIAGWGFMGEADVLGLEHYKLIAVLDGRTSYFCRHIANGKVFSVQRAKELLNTALSVPDPNSLKSVHPWPDQSTAGIAALRKLSNDELMDRGFFVPPFHPLCRTICARVDSKINIKPVMRPPDAPIAAQITTPETFKELGVELTPNQVKDWNGYVGVSPVELLSKITGMTAKDVLTSALKKVLTVTDTGEVSVGASGIVNDVRFRVGTTIDPFTGSVYLDKANLVGEVQDGIPFIKNMLAGLKDVGESVGADKVSLTVGEGQATTYMHIGMLPNPVDWQALRAKALDRLTEGDLKEFMDSLSQIRRDLLISLLGSNSEKAAAALACLPWSYKGVTIGELLFIGFVGLMYLDLSDKDAVDAFEDGTE